MDIIEPVRYRRDGRVVECAGLEIQYTVKRIQGSNPCLSATHQVNTGLIAPYFISAHHNAQQRINGRRHRGRDQVYLSGTPMLVSI